MWGREPTMRPQTPQLLGSERRSRLENAQASTGGVWFPHVALRGSFKSLKKSVRLRNNEAAKLHAIPDPNTATNSSTALPVQPMPSSAFVHAEARSHGYKWTLLSHR